LLLSLRVEDRLRVHEQKMLRRIFEQEGQGGKMRNKELHNFSSAISKFDVIK
jgi:hypothetical protein